MASSRSTAWYDSDAVKRAIDVVGASLGLVLGAVPVALAAVSIRVRLGSPVIFKQVRPGLEGRPFVMVKLRTMREGPGSDDERLTSLGRFLRSTSIDEIPELWNVLKGDMSLVGPRPLLMEYLDYYTTQQARRREVRPGLTGLAQVSGRNSVTWGERLRLDVQYVDTRSLKLDLTILAKTVVNVIARRGITHGDTASMPKFQGSR